MIARLTCALAGAILLAANAAGATGTEPEREALRRLSGTYASPASEPWYGAYGTREFTFADGRWSLVFTFALDDAMQAPVFRFRTGGDYTIGAPSNVAPGAFEAVFEEEANFVTLLAEDAATAAAVGLGDCGLVTGVEKDISASGCAGWKSVAECPEDHDLLAMDAAGGLHFGVRPADNDMCSAERRPTALLPAVLAQ